MRKRIVAGNWKMHGSKAFAVELLSELKNETAPLRNVEIVVCPPFVYLDQVSQLLAGTNIKWGAQNAYQSEKGAYTGEISPVMIKEFGCDYVILGHSERRQLMGETNEQVAEKFNLVGKCDLKPILCLGETQEQRESSQTFDIIAKQLHAVLSYEENLNILQNAIIAYEPVWAIGTGLTAAPEQAQEVHEFIRQEVRKQNKSLAEKLSILYGGSMKQNNAADLFSMPDIDGGLIGGASLIAKEFLEIAKLCNYC